MAAAVIITTLPPDNPIPSASCSNHNDVPPHKLIDFAAYYDKIMVLFCLAMKILLLMMPNPFSPPHQPNYPPTPPPPPPTTLTAAPR